MFFIPVRQSDHLVRRWPIVTIAIVLVNLAVFVFVALSAPDTDPRELQARALEAMRYHQAHPYLEAPASLVAMERDAKMNIATGVDPPVTVSHEQETLDGMWATVDEEAHATIAYRYGDRPARGGVLTLLTSQFLHASIPHVLFNMWFLWLVGCTLEDRWGRLIYLPFYLASGVAAILVHRAFAPNSDVPVVGASGAVAGVMGAFLARSGKSKIEMWGWAVIPFRFRLPAYLVLPLWLVIELVSGIRADSGTTVAHWAHVGGFAFGLAAALVMWATGLEASVDGALERAATSTAAPQPAPSAPGGRADDLPAVVRILASESASDAEVASAFAGARARGFEPSLRPPLRLRGARALERVGRLAEADAAYASLHGNAPVDPTGLTAMLAHAELLLAHGRKADARRLFEAARASPLPHEHLDIHIEQGLRRTV